MLLATSRTLLKHIAEGFKLHRRQWQGRGGGTGVRKGVEGRGLRGHTNSLVMRGFSIAPSCLTPVLKGIRVLFCLGLPGNFALCHIYCVVLPARRGSLCSTVALRD